VRFKFLTLLFLILSQFAHSKVLEVGQNKSFKKIKAALAQAINGDTILIYQGIYKEGNIIVDKEVTLLGKNWPILDGQKKYEILSIKSDNTVIKGFRVENSGYATLDDPGAIKVYEANHVTVCDNILDDNFFGIYLQYCKNTIVKNNRIKAYGIEEQQIGNGIHCWKSDSLQIIGNRISGHRDGIYLAQYLYQKYSVWIAFHVFKQRLLHYQCF
jgi:nitrous oxidase accessory protein